MTTNQVDVLDYGYVRLVDSMGSDAAIVRAARVSYGKDTSVPNIEKDTKLIDYLARNKHSSPFEHVVFTFEVKAPLFVLRQWQRHRTFSFSELSGRYQVMEEGWYTPDYHKIGVQSTDNKQMRDVTKPNDMGLAIQAMLRSSASRSNDTYKSLVDMGCPRELARTVLPASLYTRMYATVDLHNLVHFIRLRDHEHAQYEIQEYARACKSLIEPICPVAVKALLG